MEIKEKITPIEECVEDFSQGHVSKRKVFGYSGLVWVALGIVALCAQRLDSENGTMTMFLLMVGISLVLFGVVFFFVKKERYFYDGKPMKMREFLFAAERYNDFMAFYNEGKFSEMLNLSRASASKIKFRVLVDNGYTVAYSQVYKFVDYDFVPATEIRAHDMAQCNSLNTLVVSY